MVLLVPSNRRDRKVLFKSSLLSATVFQFCVSRFLCNLYCYYDALAI